MELRSRLKQSGLLWNTNPHKHLWYLVSFPKPLLVKILKFMSKNRFMNTELKTEIVNRLRNEKMRLEDCLLGQYRKETNRYETTRTVKTRILTLSSLRCFDCQVYS